MQIRRDSTDRQRDLHPLRQGASSRAEGSASELPQDPVEVLTARSDAGLLLPSAPGAHAPAPSLGDRVLGTLMAALPLGGPQFVAMQVPMPLFGFQKPPAEIPEALWKACGKNAEVAGPLAERLRSLPCSDADRNTLVQRMAKLQSDWGEKIDLREALDAMNGKPDVVSRMDAYAGFVAAARNPKQAVKDLAAAEAMSQSRGLPFDEVSETLAALRGRDGARNDYYPRFMDLAPHAEFVMESPDPAVRSARLETVLAISGAGRSLERAIPHARILESIPCNAAQRNTIRDTWIAMLKDWQPSSDPTLMKGLERAATEADPVAAVADFTSLVKASGRSELAVADFDLAADTAPARGLERSELVGILKAIRERDPNLTDHRSDLADARGGFEHVLKGVTREVRLGRLQALLALQSHRRGVAAVTPLADRVEALRCPPQDQAVIAKDLCKLLQDYNSRADEHVMAALGAIDGPDAGRGWQGFLTLLAVSKRPATAASDVALALDSASKRGVEFQEVVHQLEVLRAADPSRQDLYYSLAYPNPILEETLKPADAAARSQVMETLLSLQKGGRSATQAMPFLKEIRVLQAGPRAGTADAVLKSLQEILEKVSSRSDEIVLGGLKEAVASPCPDHRFAQFASHLELTGRGDVALADMIMVREVSESSKIPFDEALAHLAELRNADPAKTGTRENFADARPALELVAAAPDAASRRDEVQSLLSFQLTRRTLTHAFPVLRALHGLRGGPSACHEKGVQASIVGLLGAWNGRDDKAFLDLLGDLATSGDASVDMGQYLSLVQLLKRPAQALDDLRLAREMAQAHKCDQGTVVETILNLRKSDPNLGDTYYRVAGIRPALESLLTQAASAGAAPQKDTLDHAATHFLTFQRNGRTAESAHRHATALASVPVPPSARPALEAAYQALLDAYPARSDDFVLDVLSVATSTADPTAALGHFSRLQDGCKKSERARDDLKMAIEKAAAHHVPLDELVARVADLRKNDPAVGNSYIEFHALEPSLAWVLQGADEGLRAARAQRLAEVQTLRRTLDEALRHEVRIDALQGTEADRLAVRNGYVELLRHFDRRLDDTLLQVLDAVDGQPDAPALTKACAELGRVSGKAQVALSDLRALQGEVRRRGLPIDEVTSLLSQVRGGDPAQGGYYNNTVTDLAGVVPPALDAADAPTRAARAESLASLWRASRDASLASKGLEWILTTPLPKDDFNDASRKMGVLLRAVDDKSQPDDVRAIYQRMQEVALNEKTSLWRRLTRQGPVYESTVWSTFAYSHNASDILTLMQSLERCAFDGQDVAAMLKHVKKLLAAADPDGRRTPDIDAARNALEHCHADVSWGSPTAREKWDGIHKMASEFGSVRAADTVWQCMAKAGTGSEANSRQEIYRSIRQSVGGSNTQAVRVYEAIARFLAPGDAMEPLFAEMKDLLAERRPGDAAETWIVTHENAGLTDSERKALQAVLMCARGDDMIHELLQRLQTPVQDESLLTRAKVWSDAIAMGRGVEGGKSVFSAMEHALPGPGEFRQVAEPMVALMEMLSKRSRAWLQESLATVDWLRTIQASTGGTGTPVAAAADVPTVDPDVTPLQDLVTTFTSHLMMGADCEKAKALVRGEEERKKRERASARGAGVEVGAGEIKVGGIRIAVRKKTEES